MYSCGKIICQNCLPKLKMTHCGDCKEPCVRTIELNSSAPKQVKRLFGDVGKEIKALSKIIDFQDKRKAKFLRDYRNRIAKLDEIRSKQMEQKKNKVAKIEEAKKQLAVKQEELRQKKSMIKSIEDKSQPWFYTSTPAYQQTCNNWLDVHLTTSEAWPSPGVKRRRDDEADWMIAGKAGRHSPEEPFMNLITPAAWYGGQDHGGKRQRMEAEAAEEDRRAEVIKSPVVRSLGKMFDAEEDRRAEGMKSPVMRALDKLLEEDSPVKVIEKEAKSKFSTFGFDAVKFFKSLYGSKQ